MSVRLQAVERGKFWRHLLTINPDFELAAMMRVWNKDILMTWRSPLPAVEAFFCKRSVCVVWLLLAGICFGSQAGAADARQQLDHFLQTVDAFQADFEQTLYDADSTPLQTSTGSVKIKRPGRFVWTYSSPTEQQIIADGERIWLYDVDLEQVTVNAIEQRINGTPLALLMDSAALSEAFSIAELGTSDGIDWLELTPKTENSDFELVFIGLKDGELAAMELRDNFGQATQIRFSRYEQDVMFDDAEFEFEIPAGVDVIGLEALEQ